MRKKKASLSDSLSGKKQTLERNGRLFPFKKKLTTPPAWFPTFKKSFDFQNFLSVLKARKAQFSLFLANTWRNLPAILANLHPRKLIKQLEAMRLKTKIRVSLMFLFAAIALLGISGAFYVQNTSSNTVLMLRENYTTINYTIIMSKAVNTMFWVVSTKDNSASFKRIELTKNFAEIERYLSMLSKKAGSSEERKLAEQLAFAYENFKKDIWDAQELDKLPFEVSMQRLNILELLERMQQLNNQIINQRAADANKMADRVTKIIIVLGFLFFVFVFFAMFYFPEYIADPIQRMTESIRQIAQKNYNQRLDIGHSDEFGEMADSFNDMAQKLALYESINVAQILTEKKRTETIVSRMNEAIIGLDDSKTILFANPPALDLLNVNQEDLIGQSAEKISKKNNLLRNLLKEVLNNQVRESTTFPAISIDKDGKRQYFNKDVLRVESRGDDLHTSTNVGYVIILKNVTELKEQDLAKTNFMATLSHELKTPISAIDMSLNLLEDKRVGGLNEEQIDLTGTIRQNTSRLLKMVNEILDISRIETGKLQLNFETASPDEVVVRALDNVKTFIAEKQIEVLQYIEPDLPEIKLDFHKTTAVLVNILTNAVRYTPEKDSIEIVVVRQDGTVEFSVKDHGPGISEEEQRKLFQPYRRAQGDKTKGTGLGLAISKEFVEAQGGKIWVVSKPGVGSTFGFVLPVTTES